MSPLESPFPHFWWGTDLEDAGLGALRPDVGTYGKYEFGKLPVLPFELRGDFGWLATSQEIESSIGSEKAEENPGALAHLIEAAGAKGLQLPAEFEKFLNRVDLQNRIRSNTDCFLDLCPDLVESPIGDGCLVRFLADSQACLFWYLYLPRKSSDHAVLASPDFYGTEAEQWTEEEPDPSDLVFVAPSFESFICRFWLENEIWFAAYEETTMSDACQAYVDSYGHCTR